MQRFALDTFWARYGRTEFSETEFSKALARLPACHTDGPWVAGGSVRRLISRLPQDSDFDFFFRDEAQFDAFVSDMKERGAAVTAESEFNITFRLKADEETKQPSLKVQAIRIAYQPSLEETLEAFDFSLCQCGFDGVDLIFGPWTLYDIANKRLVPGKITYGVSSLRRIIKYTKQGFTICGGGLTGLLQQIVDDPSIIQGEVEYVD